MGLNKIKNLILVFLFFINYAAAQQNTAGEIMYERKADWIKVMNRAKHLSKEEKDRMTQTWKNETDFKQKMKLSFANNASFYTYENQQQFTEDGTYSWRNDDLYFTRDFTNNVLFNIQQTLGKTYIVSDTLRQQNWKVFNEIKEVAGYLCMKATQYDSVKKQNITAWFSMDLPIPAGPEEHYGLPGTILETVVDDEAIIVTAISVKLQKDLSLPALPKKQKGKKVNIESMNKLVSSYLSQQEKMEQFAWGLRY